MVSLILSFLGPVVPLFITHMGLTDKSHRTIYLAFNKIGFLTFLCGSTICRERRMDFCHPPTTKPTWAVVKMRNWADYPRYKVNEMEVREEVDGV